MVKANPSLTFSPVWSVTRTPNYRTDRLQSASIIYCLPPRSMKATSSPVPVPPSLCLHPPLTALQKATPGEQVSEQGSRGPQGEVFGSLDTALMCWVRFPLPSHSPSEGGKWKWQGAGRKVGKNRLTQQKGRTRELGTCSVVLANGKPWRVSQQAVMRQPPWLLGQRSQGAVAGSIVVWNLTVLQLRNHMNTFKGAFGCFVFFCFWDKVSCSQGWLRTPCVAEDGLKFLVCLSLHSAGKTGMWGPRQFMHCWDSNPDFVYVRQQLYQPSYNPRPVKRKLKAAGKGSTDDLHCRKG